MSRDDDRYFHKQRYHAYLIEHCFPSLDDALFAAVDLCKEFKSKIEPNKPYKAKVPSGEGVKVYFTEDAGRKEPHDDMLKFLAEFANNHRQKPTTLELKWQDLRMGAQAKKPDDVAEKREMSGYLKPVEVFQYQADARSKTVAFLLERRKRDDLSLPELTVLGHSLHTLDTFVVEMVQSRLVKNVKIILNSALESLRLGNQRQANLIDASIKTLAERLGQETVDDGREQAELETAPSQETSGTAETVAGSDQQLEQARADDRKKQVELGTAPSEETSGTAETGDGSDQREKIGVTVIRHKQLPSLVGWKVEGELVCVGWQNSYPLLNKGTIKENDPKLRDLMKSNKDFTYPVGFLDMWTLNGHGQPHLIVTPDAKEQFKYIADMFDMYCRFAEFDFQLNPYDPAFAYIDAPDPDPANKDKDPRAGQRMDYANEAVPKANEWAGRDKPPQFSTARKPNAPVSAWDSSRPPEANVHSQTPPEPSQTPPEPSQTPPEPPQPPPQRPKRGRTKRRK